MPRNLAQESILGLLVDTIIVLVYESHGGAAQRELEKPEEIRRNAEIE